MDETTNQKSTIVTVTYAISQEHASLEEAEARELIRSNAPSGFDVQNVELNTQQSDSNS